MTPKEVLEKWLDLFNQSDAEKIAELYAENAVNHQVANEPVVGKEAIKKMFLREFASAEMVCIPENIFEEEIGRSWNGKTPKKCAAVVSSMFWTGKLSSSAGIGIKCHFTGCTIFP